VPDVSARVYSGELNRWLPERIIDIHCHVSLAAHCGPVSPERLKGNWAMDVGIEQSWESLRANRQRLFPGQKVGALVFGNVFKEVDIAANNAYVLQGCREPANRACALFTVRPEWPAAVVEQALQDGFLGIKPYPDLAPADTLEVSIFQFLPREHLRVLDSAGGILMLHLPRAGRLADPDNIREILTIHGEFPNVRMIVAHVGRCFCLPTAQRGLPQVAEAKDILFDISANLNADVFRFALDTVGPERLLFGSDLPITLMRGVREHVGERYINFTDGDYPWNTNRKSPEEEANYTFYLYEELRALKRAVDAAGLGTEAIRQILYTNSSRLLGLEL